MDNRRKHPRVDRALRINLRFTSARDFVAAYTKDISLGGVAIRTQAKLEVGARLTLVLDLGDRRISVVGEVVWRRPDAQTEKAAVGIRFQEMDPVYRRWLSQAVEAYRAEQSAAAPTVPAPPNGDLPLSTAGEPPLAIDRGHQLRAPVGADQLHGRGQESLDLGFEAGGSTLGIDLGTSNCCACIVRGGAPMIIDLGDPAAVGPARKRTLPSAVFFDERGAPTVGQAALDGLSRNPGRTVYGAKRFIGRPYDSPAVHQMLGRFPYKIVPAAQGRAGVEVDGRTIALTDISATLLRAIKERAAAQLSEPIHRAIITVPAYYNENQRAAVVQAGMRAGLTVERILNEPTAAAIAYGVAGEGERNILVYDLGGGTFDVSVMAARGASLQVLATGGDTFLGGEDFDQAIVDHVVGRFEAESGQRLSQNLRARAVIKAAAESAKRRLSLHDKAMVTVREVTLLKGGTSRLEVELDRATVEQLVEPLIARTLRIASLTLSAAGLQASQLDEVLLVGGQTRMPYVQRRVAQDLEIQPRCDLDPDEVVALGAGMLADIAKSKAVEFSDVLSMTIGVDVGGAFRPLLPRNTQVPCSKSFEVSVPREKLAIWAVEVYQGDNEKLHANEHLGTLRVDAVGAGAEDPLRLRIDVELSADCLLQFTITNVATGESQAVVLLTSDI